MPVLDFDSALAEYRAVYNVKTEEQEKILREYLEDSLNVKDGEYFCSNNSYCAAIWWNVNH